MDNKTKVKILRALMIIGGILVASYVVYFIYTMYAGTSNTAELGSAQWHTNVNKRQQLFSNMPLLFGVAAIGMLLLGVCRGPYKRLNSGLQGEKQTKSVLDNLPQGYKVISNVAIEFDGKRAEIDNLVLSSRGIAIVETKNFKGELYGEVDGYDWTLKKQSGRQSTVKNPIKQAKRQAYILSELLKASGIRCWIDSFVLIHQADCHIDADNLFVHPGDLILAIVTSGKDNALSEVDIKKIAGNLK